MDFDGQHPTLPWLVLPSCGEARHPFPPQTSGFPFGSSVEPSLKQGHTASAHLRTFFFFFFNPLYCLQKYLKRSGLLLIVFHFGFCHSLHIRSINKGRSCSACAVNSAGSLQVPGRPMCAHMSKWRRSKHSLLPPQS